MGQPDELERIKTDLIGMVTHDLKNPACNVLGYVDLLLENPDPLTDRQRQLVSRVRDNAAFMLELIGDILETSRIEEGKLRLVASRQDLRELVRDAVDRNAFLAADKSITLVTEVPDDPLPITLDRNKVMQVFANLISNAIKFSREGTTVRVGARQVLGAIEAWVADQGQGMHESDLPQLFHKFSRTSVKSTRGEKSTGLGLFIVAEVLRLHHGTIRVDTEPGKGSTFTFTLPG